MAEFDPTKYGATPIQNFDPLQYGATPVDTKSTKPVSRFSISDVPILGGIISPFVNAAQQSIANRGANIEQSLSRQMGGEQTALETGLQTLGQGAGFGLDLTKPIIDPLVRGGKAVAEAYANTVGQVIPGIKGLNEAIPKAIGATSDAYNQWKQNNPRAAADLEAIGNIAGVGMTYAGAKQGFKYLKGAADTIPQKVQAFQASRTAAQEAKSTEMAIEAIAPELKGKALVNQYKQQALKSEGIKNTGLLGKQEVANSASTIARAKRLQPYITSIDPATTLGDLGKEFGNTTKQLDTLLKYDASPIAKGAVRSGLKELKTSIPREFKTVKDSSALYDDVVEFAKQTYGKYPSTTKGMRNWRIALDQAYKEQYPSAFKSGYIDVSTPAGKAIKGVRDYINDYIYNNSTAGPEIKSLIQREADIYKAVDDVAQKAAKLEGKNWIQRTIGKYPTAYNLIKYGGLTIAGERTLRSFGVPLP